jgi:hypothetical protein
MPQGFVFSCEKQSKGFLADKSLLGSHGWGNHPVWEDCTRVMISGILDNGSQEKLPIYFARLMQCWCIVVSVKSIVST